MENRVYTQSTRGNYKPSARATSAHRSRYKRIGFCIIPSLRNKCWEKKTAPRFTFRLLRAYGVKGSAQGARSISLPSKKSVIKICVRLGSKASASRQHPTKRRHARRGRQRKRTKDASITRLYSERAQARIKSEKTKKRASAQKPCNKRISRQNRVHLILLETIQTICARRRA